MKSIKVNQLKESDQKLAYANHIIQMNNNKLIPDEINFFLNEDVDICFLFSNSKEGSKYWHNTLDLIQQKEKRTNSYKKESKLFQTKQLVFFLAMTFICFITFLLALFYLCTILINL